MAATATTAAPLLPSGAGLRLTGRGMPRELAAARHPDTVRRILNTAEEIFAERGLAGARTSAIARGARVNQALLYYYFQSKEELHRFTLEMLFCTTARAGYVRPRRAGGASRTAASLRQRVFRFCGGASELSATGGTGVDEPKAAAGRNRGELFPASAWAADDYDSQRALREANSGASIRGIRW